MLNGTTKERPNMSLKGIIVLETVVHVTVLYLCLIASKFLCRTSYTLNKLLVQAIPYSGAKPRKVLSEGEGRFFICEFWYNELLLLLEIKNRLRPD
jgi:hypothetical protein